jgi:hypothetical protein
MSKYIVLHGISIAKDFAPETFGRLTSIGPAFRVRQSNGSTKWMIVCRCECGNYKTCKLETLKNEQVRSCGCLHLESASVRAAVNCRKIKERSDSLYLIVSGVRVCRSFIPETTGRITSVGPVFVSDNIKKQVYLCECGNYFACSINSVKHGRTKSCGCLLKEKSSEQGKSKKTHGQSKRLSGSSTPEYNAWIGMKERVFNEKSISYDLYGGRGIAICERWLDPFSGFFNFFHDMGRRPSPDHSIDRINVDGDYSPENCRWATSVTQANNKRNNRIINAFGRSQTLAMWARELCVSYSSLHSCLSRGISLEDFAKKRLT